MSSRTAEAQSARFASVDELLADARSRVHRLLPREAADAIAAGAVLVDIRPAAQRAVEGEVPGSLIIERNHLEWRLHPDSDARLGVAVPGQRYVIICWEGYTSSLAADALLAMGIPAHDVIGGVRGWSEAGLPVVPGGTPIERFVAPVPVG